MTTPFAVAATVVAVLLWALSRRRLSLVQFQRQVQQPDSSSTAALVVSAPQATASPQNMASPQHTPSPQAPFAGRPAAAAARAPVPLSRTGQLGALAAQLNRSSGERLAAIEQLVQWSNRSTLPLLRRALRDPDPSVALAAARAISRFRGRTAAAGRPVTRPQLKLPRNAAARH